MKFFNKIKMNSKGFTLMESIVAMTMVAITASFTVTGIASTQKITAKTHELSLSTDESLAECESFLAGNDTGTAGDYVLQRSSDSTGLSELKEIKLSIYDTAAKSGSNVRYVAFKHAPNDSFTPSDNNVSISGGSAETTTQEETLPPLVTEATTVFVPTTEATTQATTQATTEATTETTTQAPTTVVTTTETTTVEATTETTTNAPNTSNKSPLADSDLKSHVTEYNWGYPVYFITGDPTIKLSDTATATVQSSRIEAIDDNGILLGRDNYLQLGNLKDTPQGSDCNVTINITSKDPNVTPTFKIYYANKFLNGNEWGTWWQNAWTEEIVTGNTITIPYGTYIKIESVNGQEIYVTNISAP